MRKGGGKQKGASFEREVQNFWIRVDVREKDQCWIWLEGKDSAGYATLIFEGTRDRAHRVAWRLDRKRKPGKWKIRHRCDNTSCCNPNHLFRGTQKQNMQEAAKRNRMKKPYSPKIFIQGEKNGLSKLTDINVRWARENRGKISYKFMCQKLGITLGTLSPAINRKTWKHVI